MKVPKAPVENQRWDIAAHALVVGMVQAKRKEDILSRHIDILAYASINRSIRPRDVMRVTGIFAVTASSDLKS